MIQYLTVESGFAVSSAFTLTTPGRGLAIFCASHAAGEVRVAFAQESGTGPFLPLYRADGSGLVHAVHSGAGGWGLVTPPTPFGRIELPAAVTAPWSFAVYEFVRRT